MGEKERECERERRGYEPFALHAPIHQAILGGWDQEEPPPYRTPTLSCVPFSLSSGVEPDRLRLHVAPLGTLEPQTASERRGNNLIGAKEDKAKTWP